MEKEVLVIGGNGLLGTAFRKVVGEKYTYSVRRFGDAKFSSDIVIEDTSKLTFDMDGEILGSFDVIVNCAAMTDVNSIENNYDIAESAWAANVTGVKKLSEICKKNGTTLIHISSDYVFDGTIGREYFPTDSVNPINKYGQQKAAAEHIIMNSGCKYIIIRTSWIYSPYTPNFITNMLDKALDGEITMGVTNNIISSPTSAVELAKAIQSIIDRDLLNNIGVYHFTDSGCCTRYDMVEYIYNLVGNGTNHPRPFPDSVWKSNVRRPFCSVMSKESFSKTFDIVPRSWMSSLKKCVDEYCNLKSTNS